MSNLIRSYYATVNNDEKRIIDVNDKVAQRIQMMEEQARRAAAREMQSEFPEDEYGDMDPEQAQALFGDDDYSGNIYREVGEDGPAAQMPDAQAMMDQLQQELDEMRASAMDEIDRLKKQALEEGRREGKQQGYEMGYAEGMQQADELKQELRQKERAMEQEYEETLNHIEPAMIDMLTDIYQHVFGVEIDQNRDIVLHLLSSALHGIESGKDFIVRVSPDESMMLNMQKKKLLERIPGATLEIVEDMTLKKGDCIIETGGGIFDCSMDVELAALTKRIRLLAHQSGL